MTMTMGNKRDILRTALVQKFPQGEHGPYIYVEDLTDTEVIYSLGDALYKATYAIGENGGTVIDDGVKVMAKTVYTAIEALKSKYHAILGQLNIKDGQDKRVGDIVQLCSDLLNSEAPTTNFVVNPAIWEATAVLAILEAMPPVKKSNGLCFPAEAFAYAPDLEDPATWQLRMWETPESKVTKGQLGKAAASLSPGGNNGIRATVPADDLLGVKRCLRAAYTTLGIEAAGMSQWIIDPVMRERLDSYVSLTEAKFDKGLATVVVIKAGFNTSKTRYYPAEMLKRDYKIFEGVKMFADHSTEAEDAQRPERSIRDWVGILSSVTVDESGTVTGFVDVIKPWLQDTLASLAEKGLLQEMGISIDAIGSASKAKIEGVETQVIERLDTARSVDFVTYPGAGGGVTLYEADRQRDIDLLDLTVLKERRADLVSAIRAEAKAELKIEEGDRMTTEQAIKDKDAQIDALTTEKDGLVKERDILKTEKEEQAKLARVAETKALVDKAITEAELPDIAKTRLSATFAGSESDEGLKEAIKAEIAYVAGITESGKVVGMGDGAPVGEKLTEADREAYKAALKRSNPTWTDEKLELAAQG